MKIHKHNVAMQWITRRRTNEVAGLYESFPGTFSEYQEALSGGFQGTMEEFMQIQSIPQGDRPLTGKMDSSGESQVASLPYGTQGTYNIPEWPDIPNWRDLIREEGIQVGPQVNKDGGRIGFKHGGSWSDWMSNHSDQMTFEEYLQIDMPKPVHPVDKSTGGRVGMKPGGLVEPGVTHYGTEFITTTELGKILDLSNSTLLSIEKDLPIHDFIHKNLKRIGGKGKGWFWEKPSKAFLKKYEKEKIRIKSKPTRTPIKQPQIRAAFDAIIARGQTSYSSADILAELPEGSKLEDFQSLISKVKKEKPYKKLKFKYTEGKILKTAEEVDWVIDLIEEGKGMGEIKNETGFHNKVINKIANTVNLEIAETTPDKYPKIKQITQDIETLGNSRKIKNAFLKGKVDASLIDLVGEVLGSEGDDLKNSRRLFKLAEFYDGTLDDFYKVNLSKPLKKQIEAAEAIIESSRSVGSESGEVFRSGYAFDNELYKRGAKKIDKTFKLEPGTLLKLQKEIAASYPTKIGVDEPFGMRSSGRLAPGQGIFINPLKSSVNVAKKTVDAFKSSYLSRMINAPDLKTKKELLKQYRETLNIWKNKKKFKEVEFPDFEIGKHPSKTIKNWAELGPAIKKQLIAEYKSTQISPKVTKARSIFQVAEEVGSKTWKDLDPKIKDALRIAKTVKGPAKLKAVGTIVALTSGYVADKLLKEHGISLTQDENEKVLEAGMLPNVIKEHPVTSTLGAAATLRASKSVPGDPLKKIRRTHKLVSWPLKKIIRSLGTPLGGAGFAGWQIYDNLKAGESIADAVVDPIVGAELAFPSLLKENISKIIPDKYQNIAAKTGRNILGLGDKMKYLKWLPRAMGPVGVAVGAAGSVYDAYKDYERRKPFIEKQKELIRQGVIKEEEFDKDEPMFNTGGRVPFVKGKLVLADKGRRAFMKWLAGITGAGVAAGTGLIKWGKFAGKGKTVIKAGDHIIQGTPGMPDWFIPLVNRIVREGDDVTKQLATVEREIVHTKKINQFEEVTVYNNLDTGNVRVEYGPPVLTKEGKVMRNDLEVVHLEYKAPEVIESGKYKGTKTKSEFSAAETEPEVVNWDGDIEWSGINEVGNVDDLVTPTHKLKEFGKKKLTHKDKVIAKKKQKYKNKLESDTMEQIDYIEKKHPERPTSLEDYDNYLPDIDDLD